MAQSPYTRAVMASQSGSGQAGTGLPNDPIEQAAKAAQEEAAQEAARRQAKQAADAAAASQNAADIAFGNAAPQWFTTSPDPFIRSGQQAGIQRGALIYGQGYGQTGKQVQQIMKEREMALQGTDPASTYASQSAGRQIRAARAEAGQAGRTTTAQEAQIRRSAESDAAAQISANRAQALADYQNLVGKVASNLQTLELGFGQLEKAGEAPPPPQGGLTVICTELHRQGYLPEEYLEKDREFGQSLRRFRPDVYFGYLLLATPVVKLMKKSKLFTKLISIPALRWAKWMAGEDDKVGRFIFNYGSKICSFAWKLKENIHGFRHEESKAKGSA